MANEHQDIEGMVATLEAKRAALTQAIDGLKAFLGLEAGGTLPGGGGPKNIRSDLFLNKTIPEATRMFLGMCNKTPQTIESIAEALRKGGVESKATNFVAMVQTILRRIENQTGEFFRIPTSGEWALPEWYGKKPTPKRGGVDKAIDSAASGEQSVDEAVDELLETETAKGKAS